MFLQIITQLVLRNEVPITVRVGLLSALVLIALVSVLNENWLVFMLKLTLLPVQRFSWESAKYSANITFRASSILSSALVFTLMIITYQLGDYGASDPYSSSYFLWLFLAVFVLFLSTLGANKLYFYLHKKQEIGERVLDYQYALNQWFSFIVGSLLLADVFYLHLHSILFVLIVSLLGLYFLLRLFGTILMLQNNIDYPILTVFIYLCTFEIVPALVICKVLFVNS
ncbi:MAG: hypothetical protein ACI9GO_000226 [Bacteroidia bacterium]